MTIDIDGAVLWSATFGGSGDDAARAVAVDRRGGVYLAGATISEEISLGGPPLESQKLLGQDAVIASYTQDGSHRWSRRLGGAGSAVGRSLAVDSHGRVYLCGEFNGNASFGADVHTSHGARDLYIAKFDNGGDCLWSRSYGGVGSEAAFGVDVGTDLWLAGHFQETMEIGSYTLVSSDARDALVARFDPSGEVVWVLGAGGLSEDHALDVSATPGGGAVVSGAFRTEIDFGDGPLTSSKPGTEDAFIVRFSTDEVSGVSSVPPTTQSVLVAPNPFDSLTRVVLLSDVQGASYGVFDLTGRAVRRLFDERAMGGRGSLVWDGRDDSGRPLGAGVYVLRVTSPSVQTSQRLVYLSR